MATEIETAMKDFAASWPGVKKRLDELETIHSSYEELKKKVEAFEAKANRPGTVGGAPEDPAKKAFISFLRKGYDMAPQDVKSQLIQATDGSGFLAPIDWQNEVLKSITLWSPVRAVARSVKTSAAALRWPKRIGHFAATWVTENQNRIETTGLTIGGENIPINEVLAIVDVPQVTVEDSAFPIDAFLQNEFAEQFAVAEGTAFVLGDGVGKPEGFNIARFQSTYTPSGAAGALTADGIMDLLYAIKPGYRPQAAFLMASTTVAAVRKLKDTAGRYIFAEPAMMGQAPTLMGYPVYEAPDMPALGSNSFSVAFGNFQKGYIIGDRIDMDVLVDPYTQKQYGNVRYIARKRVGGHCVMPEAIRLQKTAVS